MIECLAFGFVYQFWDELQDRAVNDHFVIEDVWVRIVMGIAQCLDIPISAAQVLGFLNKSRSWTRKWKLDENGEPIIGEPRFWQSHKALVFLTDGEHLFQLIKIIVASVGVSFAALTAHGSLQAALSGLSFLLGCQVLGWAKTFTADLK